MANGPLKGFTIAHLMQQSPEGMIGRSLGYVSRFPLLLKFLDVRTMLSVQVHPCIDLPQPAIQPVVPVTEMIDPAMRERLFDCRHFRLWRLHGAEPFNVGEADEPRALVCIGGKGNIEFGGADFAIERGAAMLLPAAVGACRVRPEGALKLLEIAVPHRPLMTASTSARTGRSAP